LQIWLVKAPNCHSLHGNVRGYAEACACQALRSDKRQVFAGSGTSEVRALRIARANPTNFWHTCGKLAT
jgi:hypothetical protein